MPEAVKSVTQLESISLKPLVFDSPKLRSPGEIEVAREDDVRQGHFEREPDIVEPLPPPRRPKPRRLPETPITSEKMRRIERLMRIQDQSYDIPNPQQVIDINYYFLKNSKI